MPYQPTAGEVFWIISRPGWRFGFSVNDGEAFAHAEITEWSKFTALESRALFVEYQKALTKLGYSRLWCVVELSDHAMVKLAARYGFKRVADNYKDHAIFYQDL